MLFEDHDRSWIFMDFLYPFAASRAVHDLMKPRCEHQITQSPSTCGSYKLTFPFETCPVGCNEAVAAGEAALNDSPKLSKYTLDASWHIAMDIVNYCLDLDYPTMIEVHQCLCHHKLIKIMVFLEVSHEILSDHVVPIHGTVKTLAKPPTPNPCQIWPRNTVITTITDEENK